MKETYVYSFKITYFKKMLLAGFDNSNEIRHILNEDHSGFAEIILSIEDFQFIDSIVGADKVKIVSDAAASIGKVAEGADGKHVFDRALERYQSRWLNDVARKRSHSYSAINITARN
jgi:hypothetical protein